MLLVNCFKALCFYVVFLMIWCSRPAVPFSVINSIPGFSGTLPSKHETGYIGVDDLEFFYLFVESERNPAEDPLMVWLMGGPGCSGFSAYFFEIGPLRFNYVEYNGSLPTSYLNPYSWTKVANIIFLDAPVGAGFSYSKTTHGYKTGDIKHATSCYQFMKKWLQSHPKFITNPLYIGGESYSGMIVPIVTQLIADDRYNRDNLTLNLKGYVVGNGFTDSKIDGNSKVSAYHRMALISDELFESAKRNCKGEYIDVDVSNRLCANDLQAISECTAPINEFQILDPLCPAEVNVAEKKRKDLLETYGEDSLRVSAEYPLFGCRNYLCYLLKVWASDIGVQKALHVREGTINRWVRCNKSLDYDYDVDSCVSYHLRLNTRGYRALVYSGDHDIAIPYTGTEAWIKSMNLSIVDEWRPWFVDGQVAGYTREYENNFTYATVKGGSHTAPEDKPKECLGMFERWISKQPL